MFSLLFHCLLGFLLCLNGYRIWVKRRLSVIHDVTQMRVKEEDIPAYARQVGISFLLPGLGVAFAGIYGYITGSSIGYLVLGVAFLIACLIFVNAQKKYNR